jgi:hypothetical protein
MPPCGEDRGQCRKSWTLLESVLLIAVDIADLPRVRSACVIRLAFHACLSVNGSARFSSFRGCPSSSQADSAFAPVGVLATSTRPTCQVLPPEPAEGMTRCSNQYDKRRARSVAEANGVCVA